MLIPFQKKLCLVLAVVFSLIVVGEAVKYLAKRDAVDLCNRIIGARLLKNEIAPYSYFWKKGDPESFYNPYETIKGKTNSITAPPSVLLIQPFSALPFNTAKWLWLISSYALMGGSIFFMSLLAAKEDRIVLWAFAGFFFLASTGWLLHVQRGQVYVVYLFLLCGAYYFYKKELISVSIGCLLVLIWLRLPFAVFLLPYLSYFKKFKRWGISVFYVALLLGLTLVCSRISDWQAYRMAVEEWSMAQITQTEIFADADSEKWRSLLVGKEEGRDYLINNSSLQYLAQYHFKFKLYPLTLALILGAGLLVLLFSLKRYWKDVQREHLFLISFLAYVLIEICLPAPRYNYTYIQWLFPFLLLLTAKNKLLIRLEGYAAFLIGLLLNMGLFFFVPRAITLGEVIIYITLWWVLWSAGKKEATPSNTIA